VLAAICGVGPMEFGDEDGGGSASSEEGEGMRHG
jgi:hypothetical protein